MLVIVQVCVAGESLQRTLGVSRDQCHRLFVSHHASRSWVLVLVGAVLRGCERWCILSRHVAYLAPAPCAPLPLQSSSGVLDLAASTLNMFSQRRTAHELLRAHGAIEVLVKLLSPLLATSVTKHAARALGNMANSTNCRFAIRNSGGIGGLIRLLKPDCVDRIKVGGRGGALAGCLLYRQGVARNRAAGYPALVLAEAALSQQQGVLRLYGPMFRFLEFLV